MKGRKGKDGKERGGEQRGGEGKGRDGEIPGDRKPKIEGSVASYRGWEQEQKGKENKRIKDRKENFEGHKKKRKHK